MPDSNKAGSGAPGAGGPAPAGHHPVDLNPMDFIEHEAGVNGTTTSGRSWSMR